MIQSDIVHQRQKISFFLSYVCEDYYVDSKFVYFLCSPTYYGLLPKREPWISNKIETRANESKRVDASCLKGWDKIWIKEKIGTGDQFKWLRNTSLAHGKRFKVVPQRTSIFSHPTRPQNFRIIANIRGLIRGWLRTSGFSEATIWYWMQPIKIK